MIKKTAVALVAVIVAAGALTACTDDEDNCEGQGSGQAIELVGAVDGKSGGSSGGRARSGTGSGKNKSGGGKSGGKKHRSNDIDIEICDEDDD